MTPTDIYINFVMYAIYGRLGEADFIMRRFAREIQSVADELRIQLPIDEQKPLYRGLLLDPELGLGEHFPFVSWSEDPDVAAWFADRKSYISEPFAQHAPEARGYTLFLPFGVGPRVLFHYSWRNAFAMPLEDLALRHPHMAFEGSHQIKWSLDHQKEVILEPVEGLALCPYEASAEETKRLDRKLTPHWIDLETAFEGQPGGEHRGMSPRSP